MNFLKTSMLLAAMTALFMLVGYLIGGSGGMVVALAVAAITNFFSYWNADRMVLAMHRAREVDAGTAPRYYAIVARLAQNAGLPMPRVYVVDNPQPNAFATGRDPEHAAVAATTGLLSALDDDEIAGVMGHQLAHVQNRDTLTMTVTATIAGAISMLANFGLWFGAFGGSRDNRNPLGGIGVILAAIVAPMAAMLVQMAISRSREYAADRRGAEISGHPLALASALDKISDMVQRVPNMTAEQNPATAHLFIVNPLSGERMDNLFSTHPDTANRIRALMEMADGAGSSGPFRPAASARPETGPAMGGPWGRGSANGARGRQAKRGPWG